MLRKLITGFLLVAALITGTLGTALGTTPIKNNWRDNIYPDACQELVDAANTCILCHTDVPVLNDYGLDYLANNQDWVAIEVLDSDGDTVSNGQEINVDCTLPGDPTSVTPNDSQTWGAIKALYY